MNREATITDKIVHQVIANKITAGTWALPNTPAKVAKILSGMKNMRSGRLPDGRMPDKKTMVDDVEMYFYHLLGDDYLFDDIDDLAKTFGEPPQFLNACVISIKSRIERFVKDNRKDFRNPQDYDNLVQLNKQLR